MQRYHTIWIITKRSLKVNIRAAFAVAVPLLAAPRVRMLRIMVYNSCGEVRNVDFISYRELRRIQSKRTLKYLRAELAQKRTPRTTKDEIDTETAPERKNGAPRAKLK